MTTALNTLSSRLDDCMTADRPRLRARLRDLSCPAPAPDALARLAGDIDRSAARAAERLARLPRPEFPPELPISERRDDIARAIADHQVLILCGETGSGKTTQLPKICLSLGRGVHGLVGHTQPRRIAARTVAARISDELRSPNAVGCKVRFNDETHPDNFIKVMTDGILLAETQHDPALTRYDTLIIDEAHERSLNIDFLLGYLRRLLPTRPDLKLIVTSATIDPERFAKHFADAAGAPAPIIEVSGRVYPVEIRYRPLELESEDLDEDEPDEQAAILRAVDELSAPGLPAGDILIFLSGEREIRETAENLRKHHLRRSPPTLILPLYARLSIDEQQRAFRLTPGMRRIILATNVAETSLTVPGIRYVIDPGFARISRYSPRTRVQRLPIEIISQASARQRAGRCGRLADGLCIRLYSEKDFNNRPPFTDPEILRTNLAAVILQMASLHLGRVDQFPFLEPPDPRAVRDGYDTLLELGAITTSEMSESRTLGMSEPSSRRSAGAGESRGAHTREPPDDTPRLTPLGHKLARFPLDPRLARIILAGDEEHRLDDTLIIAAALAVQDPRERPLELAEKADQAHALFAHPDSDFLACLNLWRAYHEQKKRLTAGKLRKWCKDHFISFVRMREWHDVHSQLKELAADLDLRADRSGSGDQSSSQTITPHREPRTLNPPPDPAPLHRALLTGLLSSIGKLPDPTRQPANRFEYHGPRGLRFNIFPGSGLFKKNPKWIVAAEIVKTTKTYARTVAAVKPEWIEHAARHLLKRTHLDPHWDEHRAQVRASERITLFGLELVAARSVHFGPINPPLAREIFIHHALIEGQYWSNQPFAKHNSALVEHVESLQHKLRSRDFVLDIQARFNFFDKRLPPDVYSGQTFEAWLRGAQRTNPRILFMSLAELLEPGWNIDPHTLAHDFPDTLPLPVGGGGESSSRGRDTKSVDPHHVPLGGGGESSSRGRDTKSVDPHHVPLGGGGESSNRGRDTMRADPSHSLHTSSPAPGGGGARVFEGGEGASARKQETLNTPENLFPLTYLYHPGHPADGVTLTIPLHALALLTQERCEWLIPGYLETRITELIRTLPKDSRRALGPAPDAAQKVLAHLTFAQGILLDSLARALSRIAATPINPRDFNPAALPPELQLNIRVIDSPPNRNRQGAGPSPRPAAHEASASEQSRLTILAESRDLASIQSQLRAAVQGALAATQNSPFNRDNLTDWDFDELPREILLDRAGLRFPAYPALIDPRTTTIGMSESNARDERSESRGSPRTRSVSLRLLDTPSRADFLTRQGLRRLFSLRARDDIRWHIDHSPLRPAIFIDYGPIGDTKSFSEDLADLIAHVAFLEDAPEHIRTREAFTQRLNERQPRMEPAADAVMRLVHEILLARQSLALRFPEFVAAPSAPYKGPQSLAPAVSDIRLQIAMLIPPGFVASIPWPWLPQLPRYLQAIQRRIQRLLSAGSVSLQRDTSLMDQVRPLWVAWLDRARLHADQHFHDPATLEFRWLIEELRVSLFAQELGTITPVSLKRLERAWADLPMIRSLP
jgi:HrpA-like RNA helicase